MNWQHLQAFVWLRWRLLVNQWRRAGAFNAVLMMIVTVGCAGHGGPAVHRLLHARAVSRSPRPRRCT